MALQARCGEWFTFYENLIRKDYLARHVTLHPGATVVDIGANIGAFAILAAKVVGSSGRVYAFEPDPIVCARLRANVQLNSLSNIVINSCAVGGTSGQIRLFRHAKNAYTSVLEHVDGRDHNPVESVTVPVMDINDVLDHCGGDVDLMKVDCEGAEYAIFDALTPEKAQIIRQIRMEVHDVPGRERAHLHSRLETLGFSVIQGYPLTATRCQSTS